MRKKQQTYLKNLPHKKKLHALQKANRPTKSKYQIKQNENVKKAKTKPTLNFPLQKATVLQKAIIVKYKSKTKIKIEKKSNRLKQPSQKATVLKKK